MSTAIVTGITGQDGTYLKGQLLEAGYDVVGLVRPGRFPSGAAEGAAPGEIRLLEWDMTDQARLEAILDDVRPAEFYNLAAFSSGSGMFDQPAAIGDVNGLAVTRILDAIARVDRSIRFCQASSSEMFGAPIHSPQREDTPFRPRSPYGAAKLYAHQMVGIYRQRYGLFACSAILFNHESPSRGDAFVTHKVSRAAAAIKLGLASELPLGNLDARRDWGFAGEYVEAMRRMLRAAGADDYVIATGKTHSVRELCEIAFSHVGLDYRDYVRSEPDAYRSDDGLELVGDASKAARDLGWTATTRFEALVGMMVDADLKRLGS